ncbi:hypothetical protein FHG87_021747 [Trinorchestia longiramus]|nr:hypothetical protein FHG87_021747 [Trinorchestia longiramus]
MPCGCFGGGSKKKGKQGLEGPPKPPKLGLDEPVKEERVFQQEQTPVYTTPVQQDARPTSINEKLTGNGTVEKTPPSPPPPAVTTPQSDSVLVVDGGSTRSTGARCRAELYAKRREFFRPLYEVSLNSSSGGGRYYTPRSSNTLPSRGKRGGYHHMGDGTGGYFTPEGKYVSAEEAAAEGGRGRVENGEPMSFDGVTGITLEGQYVDADGRVVDRPARPLSQPSAEQWRELPAGDEGPQEEFLQKRQQIIQHQQPGGAPTPPPPPPAPKQVNPHFIEFQEKHHKILFDPEHQPQHRNTDPELAQKLVEERLTELDKLHNEVKDHYEKKMKNGPVDVDSLVEKYTEERWKKMVELWESEGLVVEGGIVVVDDKGNVIEREMKQSGDGGHVVEKVTRTVEKIGDDGEKIIETLESDGNRTVKVVESTKEIVRAGLPGTITTTEQILVERMTGSDAPTTIVTPPTPQIDLATRVPPLEMISEAAMDVADDKITIVETQNSVVMPLFETQNFEGMTSESLLQQMHDSVDRQMGGEEESQVPPQTCTPPPSPERDHRPTAPPVEDAGMVTSVCAGNTEEIVISKGSATPPPSPPLPAAADQQT